MITESFQTSVFYVFATLSIMMALGVVLFSNIMHSVICLMSVLIISAAFYLMLGSEFLAGVQLLVYVGGIVVLIVFAIMLTGTGNLVSEKAPRSRKFFAFLGSVTFFSWATSAIVNSSFLINSYDDSKVSEAKMIGLSLLDYGENGYILPFEIISLLLLAVLIGGIVVARKDTAK